jgi:hypothetical protein
MPPKNMATAKSGKKLAAVPKSGCNKMRNTGRAMMPTALANERSGAL